MTYCGKCGAENPDGNGFCYRCGARLEGSPYRSASDVREIKVERPEPPKAARLEEVPDNGSPYRSFKDVRTRTAAGTNAEVPGEGKTDTVTDYTKVDLPGVRRKAPKSNDHTSVLAVIIVAAVLIVACAAILYYQQSEDSEGEYHSFYDLPRDHPLYGVNTPDGEYVYHGTASYQGTTIDVVMTIQIEDGLYVYYSINGERLSQSELDELNNPSEEYSFDIGYGYSCTDGTRKYTAYAVNYSDGSTTYTTSEGIGVCMVGSYQGMTMDLTLDGWSIATHHFADSSNDSLVIGPEIIDRYTFGEGC